MLLGLRLGESPRAVVTTTPRPAPALGAILAMKETGVTRGRTADNPHLAADFQSWMLDLYGGTRLGRQELEGALLEEAEGALWTRELIERCRIESVIARSEATKQSSGSDSGLLRCARNDDIRRIVVGVDPPASAGGTCRIVVCGAEACGTVYSARRP